MKDEVGERHDGAASEASSRSHGRTVSFPGASVRPVHYTPDGTRSPYLTLPEAAAYLRVHPDTLRAKAKAGAVQSFQPVKDLLFKVEWLEAMGRRRRR